MVSRVVGGGETDRIHSVDAQNFIEVRNEGDCRIADFHIVHSPVEGRAESRRPLSTNAQFSAISRFKPLVVRTLPVQPRNAEEILRVEDVRHVP